MNEDELFDLLGQTTDPAAQDRILARIAELRSGGNAGLDATRAAIGQGTLLGFGDEIEAGVRTGAGLWGDYEETRDDIRRQNQRFREAHPVLSGGLEIGGGFLTGPAGATRATAAMAGRNLIGNPLMRNAITGAAEGAVAGVGTSNADLLSAETGLNAALGGTIGGGVGAGVGRFLDAAPGNTLGPALGREIEGRYPGGDMGGALAELNRGFEQPWARGADLDPVMTSAAIRARPENQRQFMGDMDARQGQQASVLADQVRETTGVDLGRSAARNQLVESRRQLANDLYAGLEMQPVTPTTTMVRQLRQNELAQGGNYLRRALNVTRQQFGQEDMDLETAVNQFDFWHNYQQILRDAADKRFDSSAPLSSTEARELTKSRDKIMDDMFDQPGWGDQYKIATDKYQRDSQIIDALDNSEKLNKMDLDEVRQMVEEFEPGSAEAQQFAGGVVSDIIEKVSRRTDTTNLPRTIVANQGMRDRIRLILDHAKGEGTADKLFDELNRLSTMTDTYGRLFRQSATAENLATDTIAANQQLEESITDAVMSGSPGDIAKAIVGSVTGNPTVKVMPKEVAGRVLDLGMAQSPAQINAALAALKQQATPNPALQAVAPGLAAGASVAGTNYMQTGGGF